jgi:outer membrane receptor protein involved in Fe transport
MSVYRLLFCVSCFFLLVPLWAQDDLDFSDMSLEDLLNVEVTTAGKKSQKISEIPASVVIFTRDDIEAHGFTSLEQIIANVPGMYSMGNAFFGGGTNYGVRGFVSPGYSNDVMVLVNGANQMEDFGNAYSTDRAVVPVEAIDRIEIVRGPMAVVYGSAAFMGVINIITNQAPEGGERVVSFSAGSRGTTKGFARIAGREGDLDYVFNGTVYDSDGMDEPYSSMQSSTAVIESWGVPADRRTQYGRHQNYFGFSGKYKGFTLDVNSMDNDRGIEISFVPAKPEGDTSHFKATDLLLQYEKEVSDHIKWAGKFGYYNYTQKGDITWFTPTAAGYFDISSKAYETEVNLFLDYEKFGVTFGLYRRTTTEASEFIDIPSVGLVDWEYHAGEDIHSDAFFSQADWKLTDRLTLVGGIRFEKVANYTVLGTLGVAGGQLVDMISPATGVNEVDIDDLKTIPRLAGIFAINDKNVVKVMYGTSAKRPSFVEAYSLGSPSVNLLEYAEMTTLEVNYGATFNNFAFNMSVFRNDIENLITRTNEQGPDGQLIVRVSNAGKQYTNGLEVTLNLRPTERFALDFSAVYNDSENETVGYEGIELGYAPELLGYLKGSFRFGEKTRLGFSGQYVDDMHSGWDIAAGARSGLDVDSYFITNVNLRVENLFKSFFMNLAVTNAFDEEFHYVSNPNTTWSDVGPLGDERLFLVTFGLDF